MKLAVLSIEGKELRKLEVDESVFGIEPNMAVLHQAYVTQRANQRSGTVKTKTRGEVQGSTAKIRRQKYTGRARAGSNRSPTRVGGGLVFGPRPRSYAKAFPKKMRRLAIRSALSGKVADGQLVIVDQLAMKAPKTKEMIRILQNVGFERSALVVTGEADRMVLASVRNLHKTRMVPAAYLNVVDMLNHAGVVMTVDAVKVAERLWGAKEAPAKPKPAAPARPRGSRAEAPPEEAPAAEAVAEEAPAAKPARAPRAPKPKAEVPAAEPEAKPKRAARPRAEAPAEPEAAEKPKRTRAKAAPEAAADEEPKPRARRTKKTDEGEGS
jgi:large subunit ribosomal protein L4